MRIHKNVKSREKWMWPLSRFMTRRQRKKWTNRQKCFFVERTPTHGDQMLPKMLPNPFFAKINV
jgi:hypothetical protein